MERTQRRMKILLGEGLITSDSEVDRRRRRIRLPPSTPAIQAYGGSWWIVLRICARSGNQPSPSTLHRK